MLTRILSSSVLKTLRPVHSLKPVGSFLSFPFQLCVRPISTGIPLLNGPRTMKEERYRKKDKVPEEYRIIYRAPMEYYLSGKSG